MSFDQFARVITDNGGSILEPPFRVPSDCVAGRFTANGRVLGVATFANTEQMQAALTALFALDRGEKANSVLFEPL